MNLRYYYNTITGTNQAKLGRRGNSHNLSHKGGGSVQRCGATEAFAGPLGRPESKLTMILTHPS
jgi:hypothetical protein